MSVTFNGVELETTFNMTAIGRGTYGAAERDIEQIHVPGRNGDLLYDNGGFKNVNVVFPCSIISDFPANARELRNFLLGSPGYHKLVDSYHPDEYRMAEFRGPFEPDVHTYRNNDSANFDLVFNCKPQRWLADAETNVCYPHCTLDASNVTGDPWTYEFRFFLEAGKTCELDLQADNVASSAWTYSYTKDGTTSVIAIPTVDGGEYTFTAVRDCYMSIKIVSTAGDCFLRLRIDGKFFEVRGVNKNYGTVLSNPTYFNSEPVITVTFRKTESNLLTCKWGTKETGAQVNQFTVDVSGLTRGSVYTYVFDSEYETVKTAAGVDKLSTFNGAFPYFAGGKDNFIAFTGADSIVTEYQTKFWRV